MRVCRLQNTAGSVVNTCLSFTEHCRYNDDGYRYALHEHCWEYYECYGGRSYYHECPEGFRFDMFEDKCVRDASCKSNHYAVQGMFVLSTLRSKRISYISVPGIGFGWVLAFMVGLRFLDWNSYSTTRTGHGSVPVHSCSRWTGSGFCCVCNTHQSRLVSWRKQIFFDATSN